MLWHNYFGKVLSNLNGFTNDINYHHHLTSMFYDGMVGWFDRIQGFEGLHHAPLSIWYGFCDPVLFPMPILQETDNHKIDNLSLILWLNFHLQKLKLNCIKSIKVMIHNLLINWTISNTSSSCVSRRLNKYTGWAPPLSFLGFFL